MNIEFSNYALEELESIKDYIKKDSLYYATNFIEKIFEAIKNTGDFPRMGRIVPEIGNENIREILVKKYRVIYKIEKDKNIPSFVLVKKIAKILNISFPFMSLSETLPVAIINNTQFSPITKGTS